jgi:1-deoxy-D-xylulose-5-phosphate reductoisomerase
MNAANEISVEAFLREQIGFMQMTGLIEEIMNTVHFIRTPGIEELEETDRASMIAAREYIKKTQVR